MMMMVVKRGVLVVMMILTIIMVMMMKTSLLATSVEPVSVFANAVRILYNENPLEGNSFNFL